MGRPRNSRPQLTRDSRCSALIDVCATLSLDAMNARLEMFSDGVFAIAITLLVLEIAVPPLEAMHSVGDVWSALAHLWPSFFALVLSFIIIWISWLGHHNLLQLVDKTSPQFQAANGFFLFTVIIIPFPAAFMSEYLSTPYAQPAVVVYCLMSLLHSIGWNLLAISVQRPKWLLKASARPKIKEVHRGTRMGFVIYLALTILAWWLPYVAIVAALMTWIYWLYLDIRTRTEVATDDNPRTAETE